MLILRKGRGGRWVAKAEGAFQDELKSRTGSTVICTPFRDAPAEFVAAKLAKSWGVPVIIKETVCPTMWTLRGAS